MREQITQPKNKQTNERANEEEKMMQKYGIFFSFGVRIEFHLCEPLNAATIW